MILYTEEKNNKCDLTFRPTTDPKEVTQQYKNIDKKDIIITVSLYLLIGGILLWNII